MAVQTLKLAGKRYVLLPEREYLRLSSPKTTVSAEDRHDATALRRRLATMRRSGEKPVPYAQARQKGNIASPDRKLFEQKPERFWLFRQGTRNLLRTEHSLLAAFLEFFGLVSVKSPNPFNSYHPLSFFRIV
jgi:hypothetical protein